VIGPWAIRNAIVHQRLILSDTNGGISLWYGVIRSDAEQQAGEAQLWAIPNLADRQSLALRWAAARIAEDPLWFVGRMRFKIASLYLLQIRNYAVGDIITIDPHDQLVAMGAGENPQSWSAIADTEYVVIMLAAIAGMCFKTNRRRLIPVLIWVLFATFMSAITIGHLRLRLPIVAALIPCAAYGLTLLYTALTSRHSKQVAVPGDRVRSDRPAARHTWPWAVLMLAGWLLFFGLIFSTRYLTWARSWSALYQANTAIAAQQFGRAQSQLERARAIDPNNPLRTMDLADLAFQTGNTEQALELYTQTLQLEDRNLYAHAMRSRIAALLGKAAIAANDQAALAGYGRDTNEVYSWAWDTFNDPPVTRVVPGDPNALGRFVGFAPATPDLTSGRWTLGEAKIRLQDSCGTLILRVRGPNGRSVAVAVADRAAAHIFELTGSEQELRIPLTCTPGTVLANQSIVVDLKSATSLIDLEHSPWYGGIIVLEARIT
jgi:hypothetical protein